MYGCLPFFIATNQLKRCGKPRFYVRGQLSSYTHEFNHNARVSYKCAGKSTYVQTVCINGKWDPEPDCLGKSYLKDFVDPLLLYQKNALEINMLLN